MSKAERERSKRLWIWNFTKSFLSRFWGGVFFIFWEEKHKWIFRRDANRSGEWQTYVTAVSSSLAPTILSTCSFSLPNKKETHILWAKIQLPTDFGRRPQTFPELKRKPAEHRKLYRVRMNRLKVSTGLGGQPTSTSLICFNFTTQYLHFSE